METVTVKDKTFTISIPAEQLQARIAEVGAQLSKDLSGKNPLFVAVLNGSFMFAADLMRHITIPSEISFVRFSSYAGMESTGKVKELIGLSESLEGRTVVVVEDIIDSGLTMQQLLAQLREHNPARQAREGQCAAHHRLHLLQYPQRFHRGLWTGLRRLWAQPPRHLHRNGINPTFNTITYLKR